MLRLIVEKTPLELKTAEWEKLLEALSGDFNPLISGIKEEYCKKLQLPVQKAEWDTQQHFPYLTGDVFLLNGSHLLFYLIPKTEDYLEIGGICEPQSEEWSNFKAEIERQLLAIKPDITFDWTSANSSPEITEIIKETEDLPFPSKEELAGAKEIMQPVSLKILKLILKEGGLFASKLEERLGKQDDALKKLEKLNLLNKDFVVLCRKNGQQILRVGSQQSIEDSAQKSFKCFVCGAPLGEEKTEELYYCTELAEKLLTDDCWMQIFLAGTLEKLEFESQSMKQLQEDSGSLYIWNKFDDRYFLIALFKNKLELSNSFLLSAHIQTCRIPWVIVITSSKVPLIMQDYLRKNHPECEFYFLDNFGNLEEKIHKILLDKQREHIKAFTSVFDNFTPVKMHELILNRVLAPADNSHPQHKPKKKH